MSIEDYAPIDPMPGTGEWDNMFHYPTDAASYCGYNLGTVPDETIDILNQDEETFVKDILDYSGYEKLWFIQEGENDGEAWQFMALHENGYYINFEAECDYTGFDCQGYISIVITKDPVKYWDFALGSFDRKLVQTTRPLLAPKSLKTVARGLPEFQGTYESDTTKHKLLNW